VELRPVGVLRLGGEGGRERAVASCLNLGFLLAAYFQFPPFSLLLV